MKRFNLIEVIISVIVLGILSSLVIFNFLNIRKESITSTIKQNISILQNTVDEYYLKNGKYPLGNGSLLTLESPALLDIDYLKKEGLLKNPLIDGNLPRVYYEVDSLGVVWGSTEYKKMTITEISNTFHDSRKVSVNIGKNIYGYNLYGVNGYTSSKESAFSLLADLDNQKVVNKSKFYKIIESIEVTKQRSQVVEFDYKNNYEKLLISSIDQYGLESAPFGNSNNSYFKPILKGDGIYLFEIEGDEIMYWLDFKTLEDTPGETSISYRFKVKDSKGAYLDYVEDFSKLEPSNGIIVEVNMKADKDGNKPSLYDLNIIFKYKDTLIPPSGLVNENHSSFEGLCPKSPLNSTLNHLGIGPDGSSKGIYVYTFISKELDSLKELTPPALSVSAKYSLKKTTFMYADSEMNYKVLEDEDLILSKDCMIVVYEVDILEVAEPINPENQSDLSKYPPKLDPSITDEFMCGSGVQNTDLRKGVISYLVYLSEGQSIKEISIQRSITGYIVKGISMQFSSQGGEFKEVLSYRDVKGEGCLNLIYEVEKILGYPPNLPLPTQPPNTIIVCEDNCQPTLCGDYCVSKSPSCLDKSCEDDNVNNEDWCALNPESSSCQKTNLCIEGFLECYPPVCNLNCKTTPPSTYSPNDKELNDLEWTTVETLKFFGYGPENQLIRWYRAEHSEDIKDLESTRIIYRYAKSSGVHWSGEYEDFATTGYASNVLGIAYVQVKTDKIKDISEDSYPKVLSMKFYNEKGFADISMVKPTVVILPKKDNNVGRETFSDESNVSFDYMAFDPRNKKITAIEWSGDIRDKYPVGNYSIKVRVKNDAEIWSDWSTYKLTVLQEKPIAVIDLKSLDNVSVITNETKLKVSMSKSVDPDGDKIVDYEWKNKKDFYEIGKHLIFLRVRDSEGYWSDWVTKEIDVVKQPIRIFRLEGEDNVRFIQSGAYNLNKIYEDSQYSKGKASYTQVSSTSKGNSASASFSFTGNGFDIKFFDANNVKIVISDQTNNTVVSTNYYTTLGESTYSVRNLKNFKYQVSLEVETYAYNYFTVDYIDIYSEDDTPSITKHSIRSIVDNNNESAIENNLLMVKYKQQTLFRYNLLKDSFVDTSIVDENYKVIKKLGTKEKLDGGSFPLHSVKWDGTDSKGNYVESGKYFFKIEALGINKDHTTIHKELVIVENKRELLRIEGEDSTRFIQSGGYNFNEIQTGAHFSEGKASFTRVKTTTNGNTANAYFNFIGTGFDIKFFAANQIRIRVINSDSGAVIKDTYYTKSGESIFSIRDLPNGNYKVDLTIITYTSNHFTVDYIDILGNEDKPTVSLNSIKTVSSSNEESLNNSNLLKVRAADIVRLRYTLYRDAFVSIHVEDSNGTKIKTLQEEKESNGGSHPYHTIDWNGKDQNGDYVAEGVYKIVVRARGVYNQHTTTFNQNIIVENKIPSLRIEGENRTLLKQGGAYNYNTIYSSPSYSNGQASFTRISTTSRGTSANAIFNFTGTAFDVKFLGANNLKISIYTKNGSQLTLYSSSWYTKEGESTYSVRNLPKGSYEIRFELDTYTSNNFTVDYIDIYS